MSAKIITFLKSFRFKATIDGIERPFSSTSAVHFRLGQPFGEIRLSRGATEADFPELSAWATNRETKKLQIQILDENGKVIAGIECNARPIDYTIGPFDNGTVEALMETITVEVKG